MHINALYSTLYMIYYIIYPLYISYISEDAIYTVMQALGLRAPPGLLQVLYWGIDKLCNTCVSGQDFPRAYIGDTYI